MPWLIHSLHYVAIVKIKSANSWEIRIVPSFSLLPNVTPTFVSSRSPSIWASGSAFRSTHFPSKTPVWFPACQCWPDVPALPPEVPLQSTPPPSSPWSLEHQESPLWGGVPHAGTTQGTFGHLACFLSSVVVETATVLWQAMLLGVDSTNH